MSNETPYSHPPLLGRRIQVVGHAGAGKVCHSWTLAFRIQLIVLCQSVFSEKLAAAIQVCSAILLSLHPILSIANLGTCSTLRLNFLEQGLG